MKVICADFCKNHTFIKCKKPIKNPIKNPLKTKTSKILYTAQDIFDSIKDDTGFFKLYDYEDKTHGITNYINRGDKIFGDLVKMNGDKLQLWVEQLTKIRTEPLPNANERLVKSIRIKSDNIGNSGIFVFSATHCPCGDGIWPAFWLVGSTKTWPAGGEIDIMEGVNSGTKIERSGDDLKGKYNISTLHTSPGCGTCGDDKYKGCPRNFTSSNTFGDGFNANNGGVYVFLLNPQGQVTILFYTKDNLPGILEANNNPITIDVINNLVNNIDNNNKVVFDRCPGFFTDLVITLNIAVGGDWSNQLYGNLQDCVNAINQNGGISKQAYWEIDYIKIWKYPSA
jgi:hypothetical protein